MLSKLTVSILAACFSGAAAAAGSGYSTGTEGAASSVDFQNLDKNQDGSLNKTELDAQPALKEDWVRMDTNSDGVIDRAEFSKFETMQNPGSGRTPSSNPGTGMEMDPPSDQGVGSGGNIN
ncbi:MAG: EF-hand domain-containing protein [Chromatocurvus sp.]